ncbi:MAG: hypothetical protein ACLRP9_01850 [Anaerovoracaceae bacterium]
MRLFNLLKTALTKLGLIEDYIVEDIEGSGFSICKWNSGRMILFMKQTFTKPNVSNWATYHETLYYGNFQVNFPSEATFVSLKYGFVTTGSVGSNIGWASTLSWAGYTGARFGIVRNGNTGNVIVNLCVIGTWK